MLPHDGIYEIRAMHSDKCLDVPHSCNKDEVEIIQYRCNNTTNQRWKITEGPDGYYEIRAMHSDKCLDVPKSSTADGVRIIQYRCFNTTNQRWKLTFKESITNPPRLPVVVISLGGSSSTDIHTVVEECAREYGYTLTLDGNWLKDKGNGVAGNRDARRIRDKINTLASRNGGNKSNLSLLVIGKSAGGVLAWNTFKRHYSDIDDFHRSALVLVDPHGAVRDDDRFGPYCDRQDLWWPGGWSSNAHVLRVNNIYQHRDRPTGANFPDCRVYTNIRISESGITHDNIPSHARTCEMIKSALSFAREGQ